MNTMAMSDRRRTPEKTTEDLFRLADIDTVIAKERRQNVRENLLEVKEQKRLWVRTIAACLAVNACLVGMAMLGVFN